MYTAQTISAEAREYFFEDESLNILPKVVQDAALEYYAAQLEEKEYGRGRSRTAAYHYAKGILIETLGVSEPGPKSVKT